MILRRHVEDRLVAFIDGELPADEAQQIAAHLETCARCREACSELRAVAVALEQTLTIVPAPDDWATIEAALPEHRAAGVADHPTHQRPRFSLPSSWARPVFALAATLVIVLGGYLAYQFTQRTVSPLAIVRIDGTARAPVAHNTWMETDATPLRLGIGKIGTVDVAPGSRIRVLAAGADGYRLGLARGAISAVIDAPPRLFAVDTPVSTVVDLGCAYTMTVDAAGDGVLRVTHGWASLEWKGRESIVPAGASCRTHSRRGPDTPVFDDAAPSFHEAVATLDEGDAPASALDTILREARARDTLTLWHLVSRVSAADRRRVVDRIAELVPLPATVSREQLLELVPDAMTRWREELAWSW